MITRPTLKRILLGVTLAYLVALGGYALFDTLQYRPAPPVVQEPPPLLAPGTRAPDFTLTATDGQSITLTQYQGHKKVLIEFFASWCPHCQDSTLALKSLQKQHADTLQILAINAGDPPDTPSTSTTFKVQFDITYPILERPPRALLDAYHMSGFPTFYLVDTTGIIQWYHAGTLSPAAVSDLNAAMASIR